MHMASEMRPWTLEELHRLPDDGNKYELVRGELFVTLAPAPEHEEILARLSAILTPFVLKHGLGLVYRPRAVVRREGSEVEPDLMVRAAEPRGTDWERAALPVLLVEVLSPTTRRRDLVQKRDFYMDVGIPEYWIVDGEARTVRVVRPGTADHVATDVLTWTPERAAEPLVIEMRELFG